MYKCVWCVFNICENYNTSKTPHCSKVDVSSYTKPNGRSEPGTINSSLLPSVKQSNNLHSYRNITTVIKCWNTLQQFTHLMQLTQVCVMANECLLCPHLVSATCTNAPCMTRIDTSDSSSPLSVETTITAG